MADCTGEISDCQNTYNILYTVPYKSTCSAETSVTVDCYLSLLQCEGHDLHHVQNSGEVGHSIVIPAIIVEIN